MTTTTSLANSQASNPYFSDWTRMGLPADLGATIWGKRCPAIAIPAEPVVQEYEPGRRRRLPDIDKSLPLDVQQAQRRQRKKLQMAESRRVKRVARGRA